jgi:hypothetical protein
MSIRLALRIAEDESTKEVTGSRCAFLWSDVYAVEDETGRVFPWPNELTWIRTIHGCYYIEGPFLQILAEWDAFRKATSFTLSFSRS